MIVPTATIYTFSALLLMLLIVAVYFTIFFMIFWVAGYFVALFFRAILKLMTYD